MQDMIGELWLQVHIVVSFQYNILCVLTHLIRKRDVYGHSTDQMIALLSEISIFWVRTVCEMQLVSYGSNHTLQSLFHMPLMCTSIHNLKITGHIWTFCILNDCSTIEDIPCVVWSCMRDLTGELWPQTHIVVIL